MELVERAEQKMSSQFTSPGDTVTQGKQGRELEEVKALQQKTEEEAKQEQELVWIRLNLAYEKNCQQ